MFTLNENCYSCSWDDFDDFNLAVDSLSFLCINVRSLIRKFAELQAHLNLLKIKPTFILLVETWLRPDNDYALELVGYKSCSVYRDSIGGGIKLYYRENIKIVEITDLCSCSGPCESLFLKCMVPGYGGIVVGGIYRPPQNSVNAFLDWFNEIIGVEGVGSSPTVICGDFNIDIMKLDESHSVSEYVDTFTFLVLRITSISPLMFLLLHLTRLLV